MSDIKDDVSNTELTDDSISLVVESIILVIDEAVSELQPLIIAAISAALIAAAIASTNLFILITRA